MSSSLPSSFRLLLLPIHTIEEVVLCRQRTRSVAGRVGLSLKDQLILSSVVFDWAVRLHKEGRSGEAEFSIETEASPPAKVAATVLQIELRAKVPASRPSGLPPMTEEIDRLKRLVGSFHFAHRPGLARLLLRKPLVPSAFSPEELPQLAKELTALSSDVLDAMIAQDEELLVALEASNEREEQLQRVHGELTETNRGVVALYDELETLHRVGRVVASQIDLDSLLRAITDATTEIGGAEFGAFFYKEGEDARFTCHTTSGTLHSGLAGSDPVLPERIFGSAPPEQDVVRVDDLLTTLGTDFPGRKLGIRSYLAVRVLDGNGVLTGALLFGHRSPHVFSERTERILASVAVQASIGLQNARLYHSVQVASAAKDQFLAMLSHELRTPLNPVFLILASLEQEENLSETVKRDLQVIRRNLQLEARLIDDLLDITRIVKGKVTLNLESIDLHSLIPAVRDICRVQIDRQKVTVELHLEAKRFRVSGDSARLQQVFWNLLTNAVKFSVPGGSVIIHTREIGPDSILLEVTDTGRGIESRTLQKIFRPFEQGEVAGSTQYEGLGLGLAISKHIVDAHGGQIMAHSAGLGQGATFSVRLRLIPGETKPVTHTSPSAEVSRPSRQGTRLLLVEDHLDTVQTLQRLLTRRGYEVKVATNCVEALTAAAHHPFDLVISDVGLPDRSGLELMRDLHATYGLQGIALSGYGMEADVARSHAAGFVAHLTKPLDFRDLERTIARVLDERAG